jgi:hypothetical protein
MSKVFQVVSFPSDFSAKIVYEFLESSTCTIRSAQIIILNLTIPVMYGEHHKLTRSTFCEFL